MDNKKSGICENITWKVTTKRWRTAPHSWFPDHRAFRQNQASQVRRAKGVEEYHRHRGGREYPPRDERSQPHPLAVLPPIQQPLQNPSTRSSTRPALALAAILGGKVYNISKFLAHKRLNSLNSGDWERLADRAAGDEGPARQYWRGGAGASRGWERSRSFHTECYYKETACSIFHVTVCKIILKKDLSCCKIFRG